MKIYIKIHVDFAQKYFSNWKRTCDAMMKKGTEVQKEALQK